MNSSRRRDSRDVDPDAVFVSISEWEYGCCGTVPGEGRDLAGVLCAQPAGELTTDRFLAPHVLDWDRELELVRFATCSAHWDFTQYGDPFGRRLVLLLGWHDGYDVEPQVTATITSVYEQWSDFHLVRGVHRQVKGSQNYRKVVATERFSTDSRFTDTTVLNAVIVGIDVQGCTEPTAEQVAAHHLAAERGRRTIQLECPATAIGDVVPADGGPITVDLDDPRISVSQDGWHGRVTGKARQVSSIHPFGTGFATFGQLDAGTPTQTVNHSMFVVLEVDPECATQCGPD